MYEGEKRLIAAIVVLAILLIAIIFFSRMNTLAGASASVRQKAYNECIVVKTADTTTVWYDGKVVLGAEIGRARIKCAPDPNIEGI